MNQGGVSWLLLNVREKTVKHQRGWRCFYLRITEHIHTQMNIQKVFLLLCFSYDVVPILIQQTYTNYR